MTERPKDLTKTQGILNFFTNGITQGKGVERTTSDSEIGRRLASAKGSIFAEHESILKFEVLNFKLNTPKPGCGAKEVARRLKQLNKLGDSHARRF
jgi:hypothetical protein